MAQISGIDVDVEQFTKGWDGARRQMPFALARAMNWTAKDAQGDVARQIVRTFVTRRTKWLLANTAKVPRGGWATKTKLHVDLGADADGRSSNPLWRFEKGEAKESFDDTQPVAIPSTHVRPTFGELPQNALRPKNLRLVERRTTNGLLGPKTRVTKNGKVILTGKRRTFVLNPREHFGVKTWGVYQRTGSGRRDVRLLWVYKRRVAVKPVLRFRETVSRTVGQRFEANFTKSFEQAMATAR